MTNKCSHINRVCINQYELIRKYRCLDCEGVMICKCERDFAIKYLPHQIDYAKDQNTQAKIRVTNGFQENICNICRGITEEAYPKAPLYGAKNKIQRYYWREISFETMKRFGAWLEKQGRNNDFVDAIPKNRDKYAEIHKEVVTEIKKQHEIKPKYQFKEKSQQDVINQNEVQIIELKASYYVSDERRVKILHDGKILSIEEYVCDYYSKLGYNSIQSESVPFHVMFGIFFWLLIQDPEDSKNRMAGFGDRFGIDDIRKRNKIWTPLPEDFGTPGYYQRRKTEIQEHINNLARNKDDLIWSFDYWIEHSYYFRNYLHAHKPEYIDKARIIVINLSLETIKTILHYLIKNYWKNYLGWPDLFLYNNSTYFFVEVKSSKDKLSEYQKRWIEDNYMELKLPFKIVKVLRKSGT
jgi:hypothetical protein